MTRKPEPTGAGARGRSRSPLVKLAGAAAMVVFVVWATTPTVNETRNPSPRAMRSGLPGTAEEFRWESPFQAPRFRISVRDVKGVLIFSGETTAPPFRPNELMRSQLTAGESYTWKVESLDAGGAVIAESVPVTFRFQP